MATSWPPFSSRLGPDVRFDKHKAGIQSNRYAQQFGLRLLKSTQPKRIESAGRAHGRSWWRRGVAPTMHGMRAAKVRRTNHDNARRIGVEIGVGIGVGIGVDVGVDDPEWAAVGARGIAFGARLRGHIVLCRRRRVRVLHRRRRSVRGLHGWRHRCNRILRWRRRMPGDFNLPLELSHAIGQRQHLGLARRLTVTIGRRRDLWRALVHDMSRAGTFRRRHIADVYPARHISPRIGVGISKPQPERQGHHAQQDCRERASAHCHRPIIRCDCDPIVGRHRIVG